MQCAKSIYPRESLLPQIVCIFGGESWDTWTVPHLLETKASHTDNNYMPSPPLVFCSRNQTGAKCKLGFLHLGVSPPSNFSCFLHHEQNPHFSVSLPPRGPHVSFSHHKLWRRSTSVASILALTISIVCSLKYCQICIHCFELACFLHLLSILKPVRVQVDLDSFMDEFVHKGLG